MMEKDNHDDDDDDGKSGFAETGGFRVWRKGGFA